MLIYNADERQERYNMPDTLKGQQIFFLQSPYCLHSDMGRLLAPLLLTVAVGMIPCGFLDAEQVKEKFGTQSFQDAGNHHTTRMQGTAS